ncbi:transglutaminase domain-containing protein [Okibacterium endophyticum]
MASRTDHRTHGRHPGAVITTTLFALVAIAVAAAVWWPIYQSPQFVVMAVVSAGLAAIIAALGTLFRWPGILTVAVLIVTYLAAGVQLAVPNQAAAAVLPTWPGFLALLEGSTFGFKQLVTIVTPVGSFESLLAPAMLSIVVTTAATVSIATRLRHSAVAGIPPFLLAALGIALGRSTEWWSVALGVALIVVTLIWLVWMRVSRERHRERRHGAAVGSVRSSSRERRRSALVTLAGASVIIASAAFGGAALASVAPPSSERDVIRTHIEKPFDPRAYSSPLAAFRAYLQPENADEPLLTVSGLPDDKRVRIAALDTWDGVVFSVGSAEHKSASGTFTRVPYRLEQPAQGESVTLDVTVEGYSGVWVPGIGQLAEMSFSGGNRAALTSEFFYNDNSATSAVLAGLSAGDGYRETSVVVPVPTLQELAGISPAATSLPTFEEPPAEMLDQLEVWTGDVDGAGEKLVAMIEALRAEGYISHGVSDDEPVSRSGHGSDRLSELFTEKPMLGDQEQYAVAAALMARELGFPARVVMGFIPGGAAGAGGEAGAEAGAGGTSAEDPVTFTGSDVHAWIEVQDDSGRWLTVDPTPPVREIPEKQPEDPTTVARPQTVVEPPLEEEEHEAEQSHPDTTEDDEQPEEDPLLKLLLLIAQVLAWVVVVTAIVAAPFLVVIAAKVRRRSLRRTRPDPADRIRGGWQEFRDAAVDHGVEPPPSATRRETAAAVGGNRALALASVADRATFSLERPSHEDADRVWIAVDDLRRSFDSGRTRREKLRAAVSLRSLSAGRSRRRPPREE